MSIDLIRKLAHLDKGRQTLEKVFGPPKVDLYPFVGLKKAADAADPELMKVAAAISKPGEIMETYEALGGTYGA